jgi:hypothetical protein
MTHTDFEAKVAERANNALKSLADIEAKASSAADALVKECDLEAQTQLFRANASVAPAVFAHMQSKANSARCLRAIASDALDAHIRTLANFAEFRHMGEGTDYRFEIILARSSARHLNQRLTDALAGVAEAGKRRK